MPILYHWVGDNYRADIDLINKPLSLQQNAPSFGRLAPGERIWAFTRAADHRYRLAAQYRVLRVEPTLAEKVYGRFTAIAIPGTTVLYDVDRGPDIEPLVREITGTGVAVLGTAFQGHAAVRALSQSDDARIEAFAVSAPARLSPWTRDAALLTLDLYLRRGGLVTEAEAHGLGEFLRTLPLPGTFAEESVGAALAQFRGLEGGAEPRDGDALVAAVWREFASTPERLTQIARGIAEAASKVILPDAEEEFEDTAREGRLLFRVHRRRERQPELTRRKRASVLESYGRLACEACDADGGRYGSLGEAVFEVHHLVPLADSGETVTRLSDLALLCANCHRAIHRSGTWLSLRDLRGLIHS